LHVLGVKAHVGDGLFLVLGVKDVLFGVKVSDWLRLLFGIILLERIDVLPCQGVPDLDTLVKRRGDDKMLRFYVLNALYWL
jgi:hypothetical protein